MDQLLKYYYVLVTLMPMLFQILQPLEWFVDADVRLERVERVEAAVVDNDDRSYSMLLSPILDRVHALSVRV